jgi:pilus assembly protein CpaB
MNMRTPLFVFGIALALVAFLVMFAFGIVFVGRTQGTGQVPVVVATKTIQAREPITPGMLTLTTLPATAVPANTYLHIADLTGFAAAVDIYKGMPISSNLVVSSPDQLAPGSPSSFLPIPPGYVALTLPTSEQQGVGGFIAQGDYINVIAAVNTSQFAPANARTVVHTVFTSVYVIRVGPQSVIQKQGQAQGVASSITVVMSLCDAQYMDWLAINATLKYVLLSSHDYGPAVPAADSTCPSTTAPDSIGPGQVDARWHFARG